MVLMANLRLRYRKTTFLGNLVLLFFALFLLNALFDLTFFKDIGTALAAAAVSGILLIVLGLSPFFADHALTSTELILRQGWYFRAVIPLPNIERIQLVDRGPLRTGVFFPIASDALYVTAQRNDLVLVTLKKAQRFALALGKKASLVYFDTMDKSALLKAMTDKALAPMSSRASS